VAGGPGRMTQAMAIGMKHNGQLLYENLIWIEDRSIPIDQAQIVASPRVGVESAGADALLPWRFRLRNSPWTSPRP